MKTHKFLVLLAACCLSVVSATTHAAVAVNPLPIAPGDILFTEFFDGWHKLDPATGSVTQLPWPDSSIFTRHLQFDSAGRVLYDDLTGGVSAILRLNPYNGHSVNLQVPGISSTDGFVVDPSGDLLIANSGAVSRYNLATHVTTTVTEGTFFAPHGIASGGGRVFITEFFDDLWEIDVPGLGRSRVTGADLTIPGLIAVRSDGNLIVKNFSPSVFYQIDPDTGNTSLFSDDLPTFVNGFTLDADDNLWVTSTDGIFRYDDLGGPRTLIYDETFFSPAAITVVPASWNPVSIPEPATAVLGWIALLSFAAFRRSLPHQD